MSRRVFVVQQTHRADPSGQLVPKYDLSPAERHGELIYLLSPTARPWRPEPIVIELRQKLADYRAEQDSILLVGNPILLGLACAIASEMDGGRLVLLQWDGRRKEYVGVGACTRPQRPDHLLGCLSLEGDVECTCRAWR